MKKKVLLIALAAILLVGASIGGTLAWLTDQATVTNTFTVGKVNIKLDEAVIGGSSRTEQDQSGYKMVPGVAIPKDPTVTVAAGSEECYVFVKVKNNMAGSVDLTIHSDWGTLTGLPTNVYVYKEKVTATAATALTPVFTSVTPKSTLSEDDLNALTDKTIKVTAYAIQAAGMTNAAAAWTAGNFS